VYEGKYAPIVPVEIFEAVQRTLKVKSKPRKVRKGHNFPFCGLFRCSCGAMMTAQWAKGHGGLYRYSRCSRKMTRHCTEPYLREEHVAEQCMNLLHPLALTSEEATELRFAIEAEVALEQGSALAAMREVDAALPPIEEKLRTLTRRLIDDV